MNVWDLEKKHNQKLKSEEIYSTSDDIYLLIKLIKSIQKKIMSINENFFALFLIFITHSKLFNVYKEHYGVTLLIVWWHMLRLRKSKHPIDSFLLKPSFLSAKEQLVSQYFSEDGEMKVKNRIQGIRFCYPI